MSYIIRLVAWLLKKKTLQLQDRALLMNSVLDVLAALPLHDIIHVNEEGSLMINGNLADREQMLLLQASAASALQNPALNLIRDQVLYTALTFSVNASTTLEQLYTSKAAVWWGREEFEKLKLLASFGHQEL